MHSSRRSGRTPRRPPSSPPAGPGLGVPKDAARALKWYDKAYVAGHWRSPLALAMLYAEGARRRRGGGLRPW
jgi:TPR repeat protein